jgi:tripartite-type tricarboxylate transporter receptor subunit TctC
MQNLAPGQQPPFMHFILPSASLSGKSARSSHNASGSKSGPQTVRGIASCSAWSGSNRIDAGIKTVRELVERARGGAMTFASAGVGSATHWAAERFLLSAGVKATHVPFSGGPAALTEVMSGRVDFCFIGISSAMSFIADGRLLPLAVSTLKRSPALPNVPTTIELGYPDSYYSFWNGMLVPAKTPRPIIDRLSAEVQKALALPAVQTKLAPQGVEPMPLAPQEFDALIAKEIVSNIDLARAAGLKL